MIYNQMIIFHRMYEMSLEKTQLEGIGVWTSSREILANRAKASTAE
jgi:hypothetical protein